MQIHNSRNYTQGGRISASIGWVVREREQERATERARASEKQPNTISTQKSIIVLIMIAILIIHDNHND